MNGVVLDTCAVIWTAEGSAIDLLARRRIADAVLGYGVFVPPVSAWEVGLLAMRGRFGSLSTLAAVERWFGLFMARPGVKHAPFTAPIAFESAACQTWSIAIRLTGFSSRRRASLACRS